MSKMESQPNRTRRAVAAAGAVIAIMGASSACNNTVESVPTSQENTEETLPPSVPTTTYEQGPHNERVRAEVLAPLVDNARSFYEANKAAATTERSAGDRVYLNLNGQTKDGTSVKIQIRSKPGSGNPLYADIDQIDRLEMTTVERGSTIATPDNPNGDEVLSYVNVFTAIIDNRERLYVNGSQYKPDTGEVAFTSQGDIQGMDGYNIISNPDEAIDIAVQVVQQLPPLVR